MPINTAKGYVIKDTKDYLNFTVQEYPLKTEEPFDVTIEVECCGEFRNLRIYSIDAESL